MAEMLTNGLAWMREQLEANDSRTVTYRRGTSQISVKAVKGIGRFDQVDEAGGIVRQIESRDYIIAAEALSVFGVPQNKDVITDENKKYEVHPFGGEMPYRVIDRDTAFRIHTIEVRT